MFNFGEGERLVPQDRVILESAETLLRLERPDCFDMAQLSKVSGVQRNLIRDRFPFPELITVGIVVLIWEEKSNIGQKGYCMNRSNGFKLKASDWEPDHELLNHFADHPVVKMYHRGEPSLRPWFRKSGKAS